MIPELIQSDPVSGYMVFPVAIFDLEPNNRMDYPP